MNRIYLIFLLFSLAACAGKGPIVDTKGLDRVAYQQDLQECQTYASEVNVAGQAAGSAAAGAVVGGAMGAVARYLTGVAAMRALGPGFPWGTVIVNVAGSFAMGVLVVALGHFGATTRNAVKSGSN